MKGYSNQKTNKEAVQCSQNNLILTDILHKIQTSDIHLIM